MQNKLCNNNCLKISSETIKSAIKCLNNGKNDETYDIFSDNFIHATNRTCEILCMLITAMLKHGTASGALNKSVIIPIPKKQKQFFIRIQKL